MIGLPLFDHVPTPEVLNGSRDGQTFDETRDIHRLDTLMGRVFRHLSDGKWHTLADIRAACGGTEASCSARFRDLSKPKFRGPKANWHTEKEHVERGLWRYRLVFEVA